VRDQAVVDLALLPQGGDCPLQIHRVPQRDRGHHRIQVAGPVALVFGGLLVSDFDNQIRNLHRLQSPASISPYANSNFSRLR
jgi:hypothetical protein